MENDIDEICKVFKIVPSIIPSTPYLQIGNYNDDTMDVMVDLKILAGRNITKELHSKKLLSENLRIELI